MDIFLKTIGAVNDETRVSILRFIHSCDEVCVCDIESSFSMIQSRISRHLKILKEAGFLRVERRGRWAYYSIPASLGTFHQHILQEIGSLAIVLPQLDASCKLET
jgi:ArsR family transcriptional regulator